jgi:Immunity protein 63
VSAEDELLYWVFRDVTQSMAIEWEARHRVDGEDSRKGWLRKQLELLRALSPTWEQQLRREHAGLLREVGLT